MSGRFPRKLRSVGPAGGFVTAQFCGHCGEPPADADAAQSRVCLRCGLGLMLTARADLVPGPEDAFLVVDETLSVAAVSRGAEDLLGISEPQALHRHVMDFLVPAGAVAGPADDLLTVLGAAAAGTVESGQVVVELAVGDGKRYAARIGACGPPPAAVVVLDR